MKMSFTLHKAWCQFGFVDAIIVLLTSIVLSSSLLDDSHISYALFA